MRDHDHEDAAAVGRHQAARRNEEGERAREVAAGAAASRGAGRRLDPAGVLHLQRAAGNAAVGALMEEDEGRSPVHDVVGGGGGRPLEAGLRSEMEARMGQNFSGVRVHTDGAASDSARSVGAEAYTSGRDVVFQSGRYSPDSDTGKQMLAHELTHVVQQSRGAVEATPVGGGIAVSHPSDRFEREAEANAARVMSGPAPVQRQGEGADQDGGEIQRIVQRAESEGEEEEQSE
ncbi:MAG: DUF4157 domain-containing protein [Acidimicrobiales bacterium]